MRYAPLGQSEIRASVVALGTWGMGGFMWGGVDEREAMYAIGTAIDEGVNLIDTAPLYGFGLSEELIGKAIADRRDEVVLATKCGMVTNTTLGELKFHADVTGPKSDGHLGIYIYLHPDSIRAELEASLARLRTDHIDLYQTHWQDATTPIEDTMSALIHLKDEGKIRAIGVCNATGEQMDSYRRYGPLDTDQEKYSMLDREIEEDQLPYCREQGMAVLAYSPLAKGLLTGKMSPEQQFDADDTRAREARFESDHIRQINEMIEAIRPIADDHVLTMAQLVIAWTLHQPGVSHVLCGSRSSRHARENALAADVQLSEHELARIDAAIAEFTHETIGG